MVDIADIGRGGDYGSTGSVGIEGVACGCGDLHGRRIANNYGGVVYYSSVIAGCAVVVGYDDIYGVVACLQGDIANGYGVVAETESIDNLSIQGYADLVDIADIGRGSDYGSAGGVGIEGVACGCGDLHGGRVANDYGRIVDKRCIIAGCAVVVGYDDIYGIAACLQGDIANRNEAIIKPEGVDSLTVYSYADLVDIADIGRRSIYAADIGIARKRIGCRAGDAYGRRIANYSGCIVDDLATIAGIASLVEASHNKLHMIAARL